ncbi:ribosome biogenesis factor YjgA [Maridesulfovibrio sp.]|jgi:ribosome-associated protein|uniref:ribosome biogenesis factor YjgA n=1 Tax=Maridesulfovibrio sp. TaxID=2795000 RepID=UPI0029CA4248|nr:ribosome biogenesis factor YjgA [Maridesulfovibrio sp.]
MYDTDDLYNEEEDYSGPSRSQKKREMTALQKQAEKLMNLGPELVKKCGLPDYFIDEVLDAMTITAHEAKRRKVQYIGKLMRDIDSQPLIDFLEDIETGNRADNLKFHALEQWRDRLVEGDFSVLDEIMEKYPEADRQRISQLARNARKEKDKSKPPKSARALFKILRELSE